ncbi:hypothetical protein SNEBB_002730, partial [Seison nebaliae]
NKGSINDHRFKRKILTEKRNKKIIPRLDKQSLITAIHIRNSTTTI